MKVCKSCLEEKELTEFYKHPTGKNGFSPTCKTCKNKITKKNYYKNHQKSLEYHKNYIPKRKYPCYRIKPIPLTEEEIKLKYTRRNLEIKLRSLVKEAIKQNFFNSKAFKLLGCNSKEIKIYLESQFLPEMNWNNYNKVWEVDHIIGCNKFDLFIEEDQKKCFHYSNLQPLFITTKIAESFGYGGYIGNRNKPKN